MTEYFQDKRWAITGSLKDISRREATAQLKERGAAVTGSVSSKTDFLVSVDYDPDQARYLSSKEKRARQLGIPIFNEAQLLAVLRGEDPIAVDALGTAPTPLEEVSTRDALEGFRELVYGEMTDERWEEVCGLLDRCDEAALPLVVDYLQQNLPAPPEAIALDTRGHYYHLSVWDRFADPCQLPKSWIYEILRGEQSAKFSVVRAANFAGQKLNGKSGRKILECQSLTELRALKLDNNPTPARLWHELAASTNMRHLQYLHMGRNKISPATADKLTAATFAANLRHLRLEEVTFQKDAARRLLTSPLAKGLVSLNLSKTSSQTEDLFTVLADSPCIDTLTDLHLHNVPHPLDGLATLLRSRRLGQVRAMLIGTPEPCPALVDALAEAPFEGIEDLKLTRLRPYDRIDPIVPGVGRALAAPQMASLRTLSVDTDEEGLRGVIGATHITQLEQLHIQTNGASTETWDGMLGAPQFQQVRLLRINGPVPQGFLGRLLASDRMPLLERLYHNNFAKGMNDDDLRGILNATHRTNLKEMRANLDRDNTSTTLLQSVVDAPHVPYHVQLDARWQIEQRARQS